MDYRETNLANEERRSPVASINGTPNSFGGDDRGVRDLAELQRLSQSLQRALTIHAELARLALDGADLRRLASALAHLVGNPVLIENRFSLPLARATPPATLALADESLSATVEVARHGVDRESWRRLQQERQAIRVCEPGSRGTSRVIAPIVVLGSLVGYLSIVGREHPLGPDELLVAQHAALAIGLEFARQRVALDARIRSASDLLEVVLTSAETSGDARAMQSALLAYDLGAPQLLLAVGIDPPGPPTDSYVDPPAPRDLVDVIATWAQPRSRGSLITVVDDQVIVLLAEEPASPSASPASPSPRRCERRRLDSSLDPTTARLVAELRRAVRAAFPEVSLSIAVAPRLDDARELRRSYNATRRALAALRLLGERGQTISSVDPRLAIFLLLEGTKSDTLEEFVELVLGPLLAYDAHHGRSLVGTLEAYLASGGHLETTARALSVHTSTLKYRLRRIAEVGGLDVQNDDHRFNAALALRVRALAIHATGW